MKKAFLTICLLTALIFTICGCNGDNAQNATTENSEEISQETTVVDTTKDPSEEFLNNFSENYPDYQIVDYVKSDSDDAPILLAAVALNKNDGTSSTIFAVSKDYCDHITLASGSNAVYREDDGLILDGNIIKFSLNIFTDNSAEIIESNENGEQGFLVTPEIHDYELTVTFEDEDGASGIIFKNKETVREN